VISFTAKPKALAGAEGGIQRRVTPSGVANPAVAYGSAVNEGRRMTSFTAKPKALAGPEGGNRVSRSADRRADTSRRLRLGGKRRTVDDFVYRQAEGAWLGCKAGLRSRALPSGLARAVAYGSAVNEAWLVFVYRQAEGAGWCRSGIRVA
jgi:hypothetical protein